MNNNGGKAVMRSELDAVSLVADLVMSLSVLSIDSSVGRNGLRTTFSFSFMNHRLNGRKIFGKVVVHETDSINRKHLQM